MRRDRALAILSDHKPDWIADPFNAAIPSCLTVRRSEDGAPHSIHLDNIDPATSDEAERMDAEFRLVLDQADAVMK